MQSTSPMFALRGTCDSGSMMFDFISSFLAPPPALSFPFPFFSAHGFGVFTRDAPTSSLESSTPIITSDFITDIFNIADVASISSMW